jgi:tRNA(adenine34) deaminase
MDTEQDIYYMKHALSLAEIAGSYDEVPVGAVVVGSKNAIIGTGYNQTQKQYSQSRHAEVIAIEDSGNTIKDWRLQGCTLYVTLQPCLMCMSLVGLSRIERLVYAAASPLFGYDLDNDSIPNLYRRQVKGITTGVLAEDSEKLLKLFFKAKRKKR